MGESRVRGIRRLLQSSMAQSWGWQESARMNSPPLSDVLHASEDSLFLPALGLSDVLVSASPSSLFFSLAFFAGFFSLTLHWCGVFPGILRFFSWSFFFFLILHSLAFSCNLHKYLSQIYVSSLDSIQLTFPVFPSASWTLSPEHITSTLKLMSKTMSSDSPLSENGNKILWVTEAQNLRPPSKVNFPFPGFKAIDSK